MTPRPANPAATDRLVLELAGEMLDLRADHSLYWPARRTLLVADTHFGKAGVFRRRGINLPAGTTEADLARLGAAIQETGASRVIVLGDFCHAPPGGDEPWLTRFVAWRARYAATEIVVTRGNHDRSPELPAGFDLDWRRGSLCAGPFVLRHEPRADPRGPVLAGHLHPVVRLRDGRERLRTPVFWRCDAGLVLPAFSSFTGGATVTPGARDRLFAVGAGSVVEINRS